MPINSTDVIKKLDNTDSLLDVMISVEDYLDSLDLFVFKHWIDGEIVDGPYVKRHWVIFTAKYDYKDMPDPQGGLRLLKYGSKVSFEKATEEVPIDVKSADDLDPETRRPKMNKVPVWLVHFKIPRRFIEDLDIEGLDLHDEDESPDLEGSEPVTPTTHSPSNEPATEASAAEAPADDTGLEI